ncbi:B3/B4 domain-containing protein (DNA/RNA-binding domain of Phe-tRNA-synthetase) [Amycolatopsis lurida]|uniref:tRNA synthetase subunit beta n=1 Tax=Amycolatopsis lurida NRRL 2430 TaxID=1460371 RepID=A0A2P2FIR6_AMYLU|nr:phenylalanine--tRNA ligase beta subunit-related protein [Amycolatopsis lurida]KFU76615.1 tRNA synthetase subunit beta [Amycolatopsis lurida NRRL 2430]SEE51102.1 B3/B4 domain-containing protein (DNA/RNA-binding domain of Phe-tRNA-synthetase) [Amycolatopsis lurida]
MRLQHHPEIRAAHPGLAVGTLRATGITPDMPVDLEKFLARATRRLADGPESELPEIQAWRRAFAKMGLKPTQYRCASESLLRRLRKEGTLPRIHPVIDLCNAVSVAYAIPVAVLDVAKISGSLEVRQARGDEKYVTFAGTVEQPNPGEVIFADEDGQAHARRWTNRQSGHSAVSATTSDVLIVSEGLHATAAEDVRLLTEAIASELATAGVVTMP